MKPQRDEQRKIIDFLLNDPAQYGRAVGFDKLSDLHNDWIMEMINSEEDETLQAHRGSYKTTCISVALPILMTLRPEKKILFMRKTDSDVKEVLEQVRKILVNPVTKYLCYKLYGKDLLITSYNSSGIDTSLSCGIRGTIQLTGIGTSSSITGKHYDIIFTDDIVNVKDRVSRAERERTKLMYQELQNIKNRGGRLFNTGTPWHKEDCFTLMPNLKQYDCYSTGLIANEELERLKTSMLPSLFAANYELRHIASEDVIFSNPVMHGDPSYVEQAKFVHIDAAYQEGSGTDYTALTICRKVEGKYYVYGRLWHKSVETVLSDIISARSKFNAGGFLCEYNADKGMLAKMLKSNGERANTYHESMNKYMKIVTYLKWEWQNVVFVEGTDEAYINQICEYNDLAEHDDAPDSLASAIRKLYGNAEYQAVWN